MLDARSEVRLVQEHGDELRIFREVGVKPLDGHRTPEANRAVEAAEVHRRHASGRNFGVESIAPELDDGLAHVRSHEGSKGGWTRRSFRPGQAPYTALPRHPPYHATWRSSGVLSFPRARGPLAGEHDRARCRRTFLSRRGAGRSRQARA